MNLTKTLIEENSNRYKNIEYYFSIIEIIEQNISSNPDVAIESCKSLFEGLSKFILKQLDKAYDKKTINKMDFQPLFKKALEKLADFSENIEIDFVKRANSLVHNLGDVRNKRGDISHGKLSPKEIFSDKEFSMLVVHLTDGLAFYILKNFFSVEYEEEIEYSDNESFNDYLDEINYIDGISYSKALFEQDNVAYIELLKEFLSEDDE